MDATAATGLHTYLGLVAARLGVAESETLVSVEPAPAQAYLALAGHLPHYPRYAVALTWDERHGWAAAVETDSSELVPLVWLEEGAVPAPEVVAEFATVLYADQHPRQPRPPTRDAAGSARDTLAAQLADYARLRLLRT